MNLPVKTLVYCLFALPAFGQSPRFSLTLRGGPAADWKPLFSDTDWNKLAQEIVPASDTSFVIDRISIGSCSWGELSLQMVMAKKLWNRFHPVITVSGGSGPGGSEVIEWARSGAMPYDTVYSVQGDVYYLDSAFLEKFEKTYRSVTASVGLRFMLETPHNEESPMSWRFGLGVKYAFPVKSSIETVHEHRSAITVSAPNPTLPYQPNLETYTTDAPGVSRLIVFVPAGVQAFVSDRWQFGAELSPGYCFTNIEGFTSRSSFFMMGSMEITYRFPQKRAQEVPAYPG